jgi:predicted RNA-binding protein with RPS1 domain
VVTALILNIDSTQRRLGLSLRKVSEAATVPTQTQPNSVQLL